MQRPMFPRRPPRTMLQDLYEQAARRDTSRRSWPEWHRMSHEAREHYLNAYVELVAGLDVEDPRLSQEEIREMLLSSTEEADA